ncbi:MAG: endospore germination permease [Anaeromicrobium sp.]|uniref:GerAB/ArcD/ProY family transporter n=1 Tax=Anaeromicrobium sp. TaxID=1929132 RepID=UPI0025F83D06|nr:endospore germination permease [Anaeromicrobium sp.]MCT4595254.1 endospore germination permease [Anaeromicrobium sp.]
MGREEISDRQGVLLVVMFVIGSTSILGIGGEAGRDSWLATILGTIISFPALMIYAKILATFPKEDLFSILEVVFGKFLGKCISILYTWFAFHLGVLVLRNFGEFASTVSLLKTPMMATIIILNLLCIWAVISGIEILGRWVQVTFIMLIVLIIVTIFFLIPDMDINRIQPILSDGIKPVLKGAFSVFTFPFAETIIFCLVFSSLKDSKSSYRVYTWGLVIGGFMVISTAFTGILVLGENNYKELFFPYYSAVSRINIGNFIQRSEIVVSIAFLVGGFIKISICFLGACKGVERICGLKDYRTIVVPVGLLMINLSNIIYDNVREMVQWAFKVWPYYAVVFQVILPTIVLFSIQVRKKKFKGEKE